MLNELYIQIVAFIQAKQDHDTDALLSTLKEDAVVIDRGHEYRGLKSIQKWINKTDLKHKVYYEVGYVEQKEKETIVEVEVSGNFPDSPVLLPFSFTLDEGKISRVAILS